MAQIDEIMEEDLRMFEQMNRKRAENQEQENGVDLEEDMDLGFGFDDDYYE